MTKNWRPFYKTARLYDILSTYKALSLNFKLQIKLVKFLFSAETLKLN